MNESRCVMVSMHSLREISVTVNEDRDGSLEETVCKMLKAQDVETKEGQYRLMQSFYE